MPLSEQNPFIPLSDHNLYLPTSIEDKIYQKSLTGEQREKILAAFPQEVFFCKWCGKPFYNTKRLQEHLRCTSCHHGTFNCYICNKTLFSKTGLIAHLKYSHYIDRNDRISLIFKKNSEKV
ncbi:MAG: C2H2-type zinc finger protein [Candidatus Hodarchaeota archaeon]